MSASVTLAENQVLSFTPTPLQQEQFQSMSSSEPAPALPSPIQTAADHTLLELDVELSRVFDRMDDELEEEGHISAESEALMQNFLAAIGEKVDRLGRFLTVLEARSKYCRLEAGRLSARAKAAENRMERTKNYVLFFLLTKELTRMEGETFTLRRQKNSQDSVTVTDASLIPLRLKRVEARFSGEVWEELLEGISQDLRAKLAGGLTSCSPVAEAIKEEIAAGAVVEGAMVKRGFHIRVD